MSAFAKNVVRLPIQNTDSPEVFQSQRFARNSDFTLRVPVPTGVYSLTLLFAETYRPACAPGARVFDISIGTPVSGLMKVVDSFDVFQAAGCTAAHGKRFDNVPSKDGIVVHLARRAQHPSLAGFIVEGYPQPTGDGQEYKAIARIPVDPALSAGPQQPAQSLANPAPNPNAVGAAAASDPGAMPDPMSGNTHAMAPMATGATGQGLVSGGMSPGADSTTTAFGTVGGGMEAMNAAGEAGGAGVYAQQQAGGYGAPAGGMVGGRRRLLHERVRVPTLAEVVARQERGRAARAPVSAEGLTVGTEEEITV